MNFDYQSQKRIDILKDRVKRCVCKSCGSKLSLRQIDFNDFEESRIEIFCDHCDRLEFGIEAEIYTSAEFYVDEFKVNFYPDMGNNALTRRMNVAKICEILAWGLENMGYLEKAGFKVNPDMSAKMLGECVVLDDHAVAVLDKEFADE